MIQKVLFLFRASPFAPVRGGGYPESTLSDIRRHTPSRLPDGRRGWGCWGISESLLSRYYPTHTDAIGQSPEKAQIFL